MEPGLTFIVRIYRRAGRHIAGVVENVGSGHRFSFSGARELWAALCGRRQRKPSQPASRKKASE